MTVTDELVADNAADVDAFDEGDLPLPPGKEVAVVACMDARLNVDAALGLHEGDAHVIRNAGGVVTDRSIARIRASPFVPLSDRVRGFVDDVTTGALREVA